MIDGFLLSVEIATICDSDKLPILSRCLLVVDLKYSNCFNILFISSFWHRGFQLEFGSKVFFRFGWSGAVKKYRRWICLAKRLMDACMTSKSLVCSVGINCSQQSKIYAWVSDNTRWLKLTIVGLRSPFDSFCGVWLPSRSLSLNGQANVLAFYLPFPASIGYCPIPLSGTTTPLI